MEVDHSQKNLRDMCSYYQRHQIHLEVMGHIDAELMRLKQACSAGQRSTAGLHLAPSPGENMVPACCARLQVVLQPP